MMRWFASLPAGLSVPLLAGVAVFLAAMATGQAMLVSMGRELDQEAERLGRVYLDGLAGTALGPLQTGDDAALMAILTQSLGFQNGVPERQIIVITPAGRRISVLAEEAETDSEPPFLRDDRGLVWRMSDDRRTAWAQRPIAVSPGADPALLAAELDLSAQAEHRRVLEFALFGIATALGSVGAALAAFGVRRVLRPLLRVTEALERAGAGDLAPIPNDAVARHATEAGRVAQAFNGMVERLAERERLQARLAERERAALLGRLVATVAHEVRNPLAGMLTAVETARCFGEDHVEREEALEMIERGLLQVDAVVSSVLALHRDDGPPRPLSVADLDDLRALVGPAARQGEVQLKWRVELPGAFQTHAAHLRQAALNLLLNAIAATPPGGCVAFEVRSEHEGELVLVVADDGPGLPPEARQRLLGEPIPGAEANPVGPGLGLDVVRHLAGRLGAHLAVDAKESGSGTRVSLHLPAVSYPA